MRIKICAVGPIADKEMFNTIEELIEDVHQGKMVILLDDEDRENEGDFVMAAECVTPEAINFMARHGRGLVCMPMTESRCKTLNIGLMSPGNNGSQFGTNFTVSIEAAEGVTTGISAADRARTIQAAVAQNAVASDVVQPGHIFPIIAQKGGVLNRAGHTEASCDLARLAGFEPAAAIVEILNDDGSMARRDDLVEILMDARALADGADGWIRGRLLSSGKSSIELLAEDGKNHYISRDVIVQVILVAHTRPAYIDDSELLAFERDDMKRRSSLHEKVEKQKSGNDDAHLWG